LRTNGFPGRKFPARRDLVILAKDGGDVLALAEAVARRCREVDEMIGCAERKIVAMVNAGVEKKPDSENASRRECWQRSPSSSTNSTGFVWECKGMGRRWSVINAR
jgi:hypothetical protein